jgi:hypothetical protein
MFEIPLLARCDRPARGRRKLARGLVLGPVFCFVEREPCGITAGPRPGGTVGPECRSHMVEQGSDTDESL